MEVMLMLDLKGWREKYDLMEQEEDRIYQSLTIEESVKVYLSLCHTFAPLIEETKDIFLAEREEYLNNLQSRMHKLSLWLQQKYGTATESS
jgi:hypothetical protein